MHVSLELKTGVVNIGLWSCDERYVLASSLEVIKILGIMFHVFSHHSFKLSEDLQKEPINCDWICNKGL